MTVAYRFVGDGREFHEGIPARDLTEADVARLTRTLRGQVATSSLYRRVVAQEPAPEPEIVSEPEPEAAGEELAAAEYQDYPAESDATDFDDKPSRRRRSK